MSGRGLSRRLLDPAFIRFAMVGSINTLIDLLLFLVLHGLGVPLLIANFVSTSCGLGFSFVANRSFTFKQSKTSAHRQLVRFLLGTGIGLWALQPVVIAAVTALLASSPLTVDVRTVAAKVAAIVVGMGWNWLLYSRWVFRPIRPSGGDREGVGTVTEPISL